MLEMVPCDGFPKSLSFLRLVLRTFVKGQTQPCSTTTSKSAFAQVFILQALPNLFSPQDSKGRCLLAFDFFLPQLFPISLELYAFLSKHAFLPPQTSGRGRRGVTSTAIHLFFRIQYSGRLGSIRATTGLGSPHFKQAFRDLQQFAAAPS